MRQVASGDGIQDPVAIGGHIGQVGQLGAHVGVRLGQIGDQQIDRIDTGGPAPGRAAERCRAARFCLRGRRSRLMRSNSRVSRWLSSTTSLKTSEMSPGTPVQSSGRRTPKSPARTPRSAARSLGWSRQSLVNCRPVRVCPFAGRFAMVGLIRVCLEVVAWKLLEMGRAMAPELRSQDPLLRVQLLTS